MLKEETDKRIQKIPDSPSLYEIQKEMHFAELLFSLGE